MLTEYRERLKNEHGWKVPLRCGRCGADGVPIFHGWTPSLVINFEDFRHSLFSWISFGGWISPPRRLPSVFDFDLERWVGEVDLAPSGNADANPGHAIGHIESTTSGGTSPIWY
jgi:hypothetical protein